MDAGELALPNEHPILDPPFWSGTVERYAASQLDAAEEIARYGADLLMRIGAQGFDHISDVVLVTALYRQALVGYDACLVCMRAGAAPAAFAHARTQLEASLYVAWMIEGDTRALGEKYFVGSLRQELQWVLENIPGTEEQEATEQAWERFGGPSPQVPQDLIERCKIREAEIREALASPAFREWDKAFIAKKGGRPIEPRWYAVPPGDVPTVFRMAERLEREAEYQSLYRFASGRVHGSTLESHASLSETEGLSVVPVRTISDLPTVFRMSTTLFMQTALAVLERYRPDERRSFSTKYRDEWKPRLQMPDFEMRREKASASFGEGS